MSFERTRVAIAAGRREGRIGAFRGIAGKIVAIIGALIVVFTLMASILLARVTSLDEYTPEASAITTGRQTVLAVLLAYNEQRVAFEQVLLAGADDAARARAKEAYTAHGKEVSEGLDTSIRQLPPGQWRASAEAFRTAYIGLRTRYDDALRTFESTDGRNASQVSVSVQDIDVQPFAVFEKAAFDMRVDRDRINFGQVHVVERQITVAWIIGGVLVVIIALAAGFVVRRVVRPIRHLTTSAERLAEHDLPDAVTKIRNLEEGEALPSLEPIVVTTRDETAQLARAFQSLQVSALDLAVQQRTAERQAAQMLVNLGRRNQNLLNRTLAFITDLERTEEDPDVLDRLFRLDHATTRIRRNAESMLVLAGANQTRTWSVPAPVVDVVRAALTEIEDYNRVDIYHVQGAAIAGSAIADVVHLLAELLENATVFSPPSTKITVVGQSVPDGYRIRIIDEGIGMTQRDLESSNRTIRLAAEGRTATKLLGLYVVGRLAARRGIEVTLEASGGRGVTANVVLPRDVLTEMPARAQDQPSSAPAPAPARAPAPVRAPAPAPAVQVMRGRGGGPARRAMTPPSALVAPPPAPPAMVAPVTVLARPEPRDRDPHGPGPDLAAPVRRVPGAQLPDLGPQPTEGPELAMVDAADVRGRLSSLAAGVRAGREAGKTVEQAVGPGAEPATAQQELAAEKRERELRPSPPAVPVRVPGAQLPELGMMDDGPDTYLAPPSTTSRWALRDFQLDVDAARRSDLDIGDGRRPTPRAGRTTEEQ
jgi:signal transduction histidine kinase